MEQKNLFGTAFSVYLPSNSEDVSTLRDIPDNQEVFTNSETDQSIIIELLESVEGTEEEAIKTHFDDIASSNDAQDSQILHTERLALENILLRDCESAWYILGQQKISKFKEHAKNTVNLHIGLLRLTEYETDLMVTLNDPINIDPESSSHQAVPTSANRWTTEHFKEMLKSITLTDPGIFG